MFLSFYFISFILLIAINLILNKKYINHATVFNGMWLGISFFVFLLDLPVNEEAFFLVLIINIVFTFFFNFKDKKLIKGFDVSSNKIKKFKKLNKFVIVLHVLSILLMLKNLNFQISDLMSLNAMSAKANAIASLRYGGELTFPLINRLINAIVYFTVAYNGFFYSNEKRKVHLINLILLAFQSVLQSSKSGLVFGIAFWLGGFLTGNRFFNQKIKVKNTVYFFTAFLLVFNFFVTINFLRHNMNFTYLEEIEKILSSYLIGPLSAFGVWYDFYKSNVLELGTDTFSAPYRIIFSFEQVHGERIQADNLSTNVYTVFKHLITDFGKMGTIFFVALMGMVGSYSEKKIICCNMQGVAISIILYSFLLTSFFSSIFRYNTNILAMLLIVLYALTLKKNLNMKSG